MGLKFECPVEETCSAWALSYFFDCVCNRKDLISFALGITSIICWAVAEVPQIFANWHSPNTETVSMAFILTWMIGDIFNVLGCWFNPGTLPTQFYLAVLYTATTVLLVVQQLMFAWKNCKPPPSSTQPLIQDSKSPRWPNDLDGLFPSKASHAKSKSNPLNTRGSGKPPLPVTASVPVRGNVGSPGSYRSWARLTLSNSYGTDGSPLVRGIAYSSVAVITLTLSGGLSSFGGGGVSHGGGSRRLLQGEFPSEDPDIVSSLGLILGWLMTCIYMTGRLPQIILNWSRDFVIGVSVSTVIFAFLGNATYLGSILVRGVEWHRLKFVLPWVVDIVFCLSMDFIMMCQYVYHQRRDEFPLE